MKKNRSNRQKSESKDSGTSSTSESQQFVDDKGQFTCPVPRTKCRCPGVEPIRGSKNFVLVPCTKSDCTVQFMPVHLDCIQALRADLIAEYHHVYAKREKWPKNSSQEPNIWDRRGKTQIRCRCDKGDIRFGKHDLQAAEKALEDDKKGKKRSKSRSASRNPVRQRVLVI